MQLPRTVILLLVLAPTIIIEDTVRAAFDINLIGTDSNGVTSYSVLSDYQGGTLTTLRILSPTNPVAEGPHRFLYVLPVTYGLTNLNSEYGDGLEQARVLGLHNQYNITLVAPSFNIEPWYGDHASDPTRQLESFLVRDVVPWVDTLASGDTSPERWLLGFSKSGFGALSLILRNPDIFSAAAAWDAPAQLTDLSPFPGLRENFGTEENFDGYEVPRLVANRGDPFRNSSRLWISSDVSAWTGHMETLHQQMSAAGILHAYAGGQTRGHHWDSGWLSEAVGFLDSTPPLITPVPPTAALLLTGLLCFGLHRGINRVRRFIRSPARSGQASALPGVGGQRA